MNQYLAIERLRLAERLQFKQHVEESLLSQTIPLLTIQPLIENAVIHGVAHLAEGGCINLDIKRNNQYMQISVSNPFAADRVKSGSGTALANIKARLALHYGKQASLTTEHNAGCFQVQVVIPL